MLRIAAKPGEHIVRRSDPSLRVLIYPVSFKTIVAFSSAWYDELPAGVDNPDEPGDHTEAPDTALHAPGGYSYLEAPAKYEEAEQSQKGDETSEGLQCFPDKQGMQLEVEANFGGQDLKGEYPLAVESP